MGVLTERVYPRTEFRPAREGGHWLWTGALRNGYGVIRINGKLQYVHRIVLFDVGEFDGRQALHYCDVRHCIFHVYPGDQRMNLEDAADAGKLRHSRRPRHSFSVVQRVRRLKAQGCSYSEIARRVGVKVPTVQSWVRGFSRARC